MLSRLASLPRPIVSHTVLNLIVAAYVLMVLNAGFWGRLAEIQANDRSALIVFGLCMLALTLWVFELMAPWRLQKPMLAGLIVVSASASYFERQFGTLIDTEMVRNVMETTAAESRHLMTLPMIVTMALTGVLPAALVFLPRVRRVGILHQIWRWPVGVAATFVLLVAGLFTHYQPFSAMLRERHDLMAAYQPGATLAAVGHYLRQELRNTNIVVEPVGADAHPGPALAQADQPVLLVFFVGETLRAENWGLNGYERDTTPGLRARAVVNYGDVATCGTSTAVSVPCMLSGLEAEHYSRGDFLSHENLADVLAHAGFDVRWYDNNTGDQGVARRTGAVMIDPADFPADCDPECNDHVFLPIIQQALDTITQDTVLFLHMIGNHGPAYFLRASADERVFLPGCDTADFGACSIQQIVNSYDNAVLETDYVLSSAIDLLAGSDRVDGALYFVSDHGESLGENGVFLHAAPYFMAPDTQTHVPMVMWLSDAFRQDLSLSAECLAARAAGAASHDNVFHTTLGLLDVQTTARNPELDLTEGCRLGAARAVLTPGRYMVGIEQPGL